MSSVFRRFLVVGAGAALLVGLSAGPLEAASKTDIVSVNPITLTYTGTSPQLATFGFTFKNTTPSATINSVTVALPQPTQGYTITGVTGVTESSATGSSLNAGNYSASFTRYMVTVTNLSPVGNNESVTVSFTASIDTSNLNCQNNALQWVPTAYTGANTSGNVFNATNTAKTTIVSTLAATGVTVTNNDTSNCALINVSRSGNSVTVIKPTGSTVYLTLDILWNPEPAVTPLQPTKTDTPPTEHPVKWCDGTASYDPTGKLITSGLLLPGIEVSCLVSETSQIVGPDANGNQQVQVHDLVLLKGDYGIVRGY